MRIITYAHALLFLQLGPRMLVRGYSRESSSSEIAPAMAEFIARANYGLNCVSRSLLSAIMRELGSRNVDHNKVDGLMTHTLD